MLIKIHLKNLNIRCESNYFSDWIYAQSLHMWWWGGMHAQRNVNCLTSFRIKCYLECQPFMTNIKTWTFCIKSFRWIRYMILNVVSNSTRNILWVKWHINLTCLFILIIQSVLKEECYFGRGKRITNIKATYSCNRTIVWQLLNLNNAIVVR